MSTLQEFDQALLASSNEDGDAWTDEGVARVGVVAAKLSVDELALLRVIWPDRPLLWQKHCAQSLGSSRLDEAIDLLMDLLARGRPYVALAALESLREFAPARFTQEQTTGILAALHAMLERPVGPLHRVVLEAFLAVLRSPGSGAE
jgi:hypothetical protein